MSEFLNKNIIFRDFPPNLRQNIKSFYVSRDYNIGLGYCVLNDNKVYGLGKDIHEKLGYNKSNEKFIIINELCGENIEEFYQGWNFMLARNDKNQIFSWGDNMYGQLARGFESDWSLYYRPEKSDYFDDKNIIEISCGERHCLGLSSDGLLYGWGDNRNGQIGCEKEIISTPIEIDLKEKIKFINSTNDTSIAVSFDGNAYYWGRIDETVFVQRSIPIKNVLKVYPDNNFFIVLNNSGKVFKFNPFNDEINAINCEDKFNDLYHEKYYPYNCLLRSEECVYRLKNNKLIKTGSSNFFDFYLQKSNYFYKTIHLTKDENKI